MVSGEWRVSRGFLSPSLSTQLIYRQLISLDIAPFVRLSCLVKFTLFCSDSGKRHYSF